MSNKIKSWKIKEKQKRRRMKKKKYIREGGGGGRGMWDQTR
jgi:hypothetical protein